MTFGGEGASRNMDREAKALPNLYLINERKSKYCMIVHIIRSCVSSALYVPRMKVDHTFFYEVHALDWSATVTDQLGRSRTVRSPDFLSHEFGFVSPDLK